MLREYLTSIIEHYGNIGIFVFLILEFLGLPLPGEPMMSFLGYITLKHAAIPVILPIIYAAAGTFIGSSIAYVIGLRYGETVLLKLHVKKNTLEKTEKMFHRNRILLFLTSRYIPGVRHIVPYLAGISRTSIPEFAVYNFIGSILWCSSFIGIGYIMGEKWAVIEEVIKTYALILVLLALFIFIVLKYINKHKTILFLFAFPLFLFIKLSEDYVSQELSVFDSSIYNFLSEYISKNMTYSMKVISNMGSAQVLISLAVILWLVLIKRKKYAAYGSLIMMNLAASAVLNEFFKVVFHRTRPDILQLVNAAGYSFPSGHSMVGLSFYGLLLYLYWINTPKPYKRYISLALFSLLILSIGISRIYLGVHYASDVLAGFCAGLAWLAIYITLVKRLSRWKDTGKTD